MLVRFVLSILGLMEPSPWALHSPGTSLLSELGANYQVLSQRLILKYTLPGEMAFFSPSPSPLVDSDGPFLGRRSPCCLQMGSQTPSLATSALAKSGRGLLPRVWFVTLKGFTRYK